MKKSLSIFLAFLSAQAFAANIGAGDYSIKFNGTEFTVSREGAGDWVFKPDFIVFTTDKDPKPVMMQIELPPASRGRIVTWLSKVKELHSSLKQLKTSESSGGDGIVDSEIKGSVKGRTSNVFSSAPSKMVSANKVEHKGNSYVFSFPEDEDFILSAVLKQKDKASAPELTFTLKAKKDFYYSVGYVGAPACKVDETEAVWQPFYWNFKRFPELPYLTISYHCTQPGTFYVKNGNALGVYADTSEFPFMPLPTFARSTFGVALRDLSGLARPMIFAPLLGSEPSKMSEGDTYSFKMRLFAAHGDFTKVYETSAKELYNYRDMRENALASTNETLDNMIDFGLSKFGGYHKDTKGFAYDTDVKGSTRNDTSVSPLVIALVTDDEQIYRDISYPVFEFMMSRTKTLFLMDENVKTQNPSKTLNGPCANIPETQLLYTLSGGANPFLKEVTTTIYDKVRLGKHYDVKENGTWEDAITIYECTGDPEYLERAKRGADFYIENNLTQPVSKYLHGAFFWNKFAPPFANLFRLYENTGDKKYLDAARLGARAYTMFTWMSPEVPNGDVRVNLGGVAPLYPHAAKAAPVQLQIPEEDIPAWRVSEIGLSPEASGTMTSHRAIFMANFAPWMLRVANASNDDYLKTAARWAVIGRYSNFPGYHMNTDRCSIFEKQDYPLRPHSELSANSFHYNHVWPMMMMLVDYLVSDTEGKSAGAVKFPSRFADASAYMQSKFYGDRVGTFYTYSDASLWMPRRVLKTDNVNVNYITARGKDNFYIAFTSQSHKALKSKIKLNDKLLAFDKSKTYTAKVWKQNKPVENITIKNGEFEISLDPLGIYAVAIEGLKIAPKFQDKIFNTSAADAWSVNKLDFEFDGAKGVAHFFNFGKDFKTAYIYLKDPNPEYKSMKLVYKKDSKVFTLTDTDYPFEFTVPISDKDTSFEFYLEANFEDKKNTKSQPLKLNK